jgi:hypothetical protein
VFIVGMIDAVFKVRGGWQLFLGQIHRVVLSAASICIVSNAVLKAGAT